MQRRTWLVGSLVMGGLLLGPGCSRPPEEPQLVYSAQAPAPVGQVYRFAVHPLHNPAKLSQAYQPLLEHLNRHLPHIRLELEASRNYQAYEAKFRAREPEFLLPNPWQTLQAMHVGYRVIAMAGNAKDFKGLFLVRKDGDIQQPSDLKSRTVSYPSPTALAACILPQYFLHQHGLNINRDITNVYVGSQESAIMNVVLGHSSAGVTWTQPWRIFQKEHPEAAAQLKVAWETPHMQNNAVMVRDDVPAAVADQVTALLLQLQNTPEGPAILEGMATEAFYPAQNDTYLPLAQFIEKFEREVRPVEQK